MKLLLISSVVFLLSFSSLQQACDDLKFDIKITNTTNGLNNGKIEITITRSSSKVHAFLYGDAKQKNKVDVDPDDLINLQAGTYMLVLQNDQCYEVKQDIIIK